jgi:hypothetical protein
MTENSTQAATRIRQLARFARKPIASKAADGPGKRIQAIIRDLDAADLAGLLDEFGWDVPDRTDTYILRAEALCAAEGIR